MTNTEEKESMTQAAPVQPVPPQTKEIQPTAYPAGEKKEGDYRWMRQGKATHGLAQALAPKTKGSARATDHIKLDEISGSAIIQRNGVEIQIEDYRGVGQIPATVNMLLDAMIIELTETGMQDTLINLPIRRYMEFRGLMDFKSARAQADRDLNFLKKHGIKLKWEEQRHGKQYKSYLDVRLCGGTSGIDSGTIIFRFNPDFFNVLGEYPAMQYHSKLPQLNPKYHPNSYNLGRKILTHKRQNQGKKNADILSVGVLLKHCPDIPQYKHIRETGGISQRIIEPFERDLTQLGPELPGKKSDHRNPAINMVTWEYCNGNGQPLTKEELEKPLTYAKFIKRYVKFTWVNYPENMELIKARKARTLKAKN